MTEYFSNDWVCLERCCHRLTCLKAKEMKTEYKRPEDKRKTGPRAKFCQTYLVVFTQFVVLCQMVKGSSKGGQSLYKVQSAN